MRWNIEALLPMCRTASETGDGVQARSSDMLIRRTRHRVGWFSRDQMKTPLCTNQQEPFVVGQIKRSGKVNRIYPLDLFISSINC